MSHLYSHQLIKYYVTVKMSSGSQYLSLSVAILRLAVKKGVIALECDLRVTCNYLYVIYVKLMPTLKENEYFVV